MSLLCCVHLPLGPITVGTSISKPRKLPKGNTAYDEFSEETAHGRVRSGPYRIRADRAHRSAGRDCRYGNISHVAKRRIQEDCLSAQLVVTEIVLRMAASHI